MSTMIVHSEGKVPSRPLEVGDVVYLHSGARAVVMSATRSTVLLGLEQRLVWRNRGPLEGDYSNVLAEVR